MITFDQLIRTLFQTLTYQPNFPWLQAVTNEDGKSLTFTHSEWGNITKVQLPDNSFVEYVYDQNYQYLIQVIKPEGAKTYLYDEPNFSNYTANGQLTGILDSEGNRIKSIHYNQYGLVTSIDEGGNTQLVTNGTQVIGPLGEATNFSFDKIAGKRVPLNVGKSCTNNTCATSTETFQYDNNGNVIEKAINGIRICYAYDMPRKLQIRRIETVPANQSCAEALAQVTTNTQSKITTTEWHPTLRLPVKVAEPLLQTHYTYSETGQILSIVRYATNDANGKNGINQQIASTNRAKSWFYNINGKLIKEVSPKNLETNYAYDSVGNLVTVTNSKGQVTTYSNYDLAGRVGQITYPNGLIQTFTYTQGGKLASVTRNGKTTIYTYNSNGLLQQITNPDGTTVQYTYNQKQQVTNIADNGNIALTLDNAGNVTLATVTDKNALQTVTGTAGYNPRSEVIQQGISPTGVATYQYDANGNLIQQVEPSNVVTTHAYDAFNRRTQTTLPNTGMIGYGYNFRDDVTSVTDPRMLPTYYTNNSFKNLTQLASPDTGTSSYGYDAHGNRISWQHPKGFGVSWTYDELDRLIYINYGGLKFVNFYYDETTNGIGKLSRMTDSYGTTTWEYDKTHRVTTKNQTGPQGVTKTIRYVWDNDKLQSIIYPSGITLTYGYVTGQKDPVSLSLSNGGGISNITTFQNGLPLGWGYGTSGQYSRQLDSKGNIIQYSTANSENIMLVWNSNGNLAEKLVNGVSIGQYTYDSMNQVQTELYSGITRQFSLDLTGNRTMESINGVNYPYSVQSSSNKLLSSDHVSGTRTYNYDGLGSVSAINGRTFGYDRADDLVLTSLSGSNITFMYNGLKQRVRKQTQTYIRHFMYDEEGKLIGEYKDGGGSYIEYVWLKDTPVMAIVNNITYYILPDHLDTPREVVDASGNLRWKWNSDAFGNGAPNENPAGLGVFSMNLRFPGQYADVETGLYYNNARYYDPLIGRYIQSDPIGLSAGINTYSYVTGNPLKYSDFSGLFGCPAGMTEVTMPGQENAFPKIAKCQDNSSTNYSPKICLTGECAAGLNPVFSSYKTKCEAECNVGLTTLPQNGDVFMACEILGHPASVIGKSHAISFVATEVLSGLCQHYYEQKCIQRCEQRKYSCSINK